MKNFLLGLSISAAFILGCAVAHVSQSLSVPKAHADSPGPQWEALCVHQDGAGVGSPEWDQRLAAEDGWNAAMNRYGAEGWEPFHVGTSPMTTNEIIFACFRRPR